MPGIDNFNVDLPTLRKMLFIYNAVLNGWTVRHKSENSFEFKKSKNSVKKQLLLDNYLNEFVKENLNIERLI